MQCNDLIIDDTSVNSVAAMATTSNNFLLQHGGMCSKLSFNSYDVMDIDYFCNKEVPKLKNAKDTLYTIRDLEHDNVTLIYNNKVIKYNVYNVEDISINELSKCLQREQELVFDNSITAYPLVQYKRQMANGDRTVVICKIPSRRIQYKMEHMPVVPIWTPDLWVKFEVNSAYFVQAVGLAVCIESNFDINKTVLGKWPLSNVFADGKVCLGNTFVKNEGFKVDSLGACLELILIQLFDSKWNTHIIPQSTMNRSILSDPAVQEILNNYVPYNSETSDSVQRLLYVLSKEGAWRYLKFETMDTSMFLSW